MKLFRLLAQLIATFGLLAMVVIDGWAADSCTPSDFTQNPLSAATPYVRTSNVTKIDDNTYYFRAPSAGTVSISISGADVSAGDVGFSYEISSCPGTTGNLTSQSYTLTSDLDFNIKVYDTTNNASSKDYTITVTFIPHTPPIMGNISNQGFTIGTRFDLNISNYVTLTENDSITSYSLSGTLPSWLDWNATNGTLGGTPDANGTFTLSVTATDDDGVSNSDSFTLSSDLLLAPPVMGNIPDQDIVKDIAYSLNLANYASTTGNPITSYHILGTLPTGLIFNTVTGVLSGQPTVNGVYPLSAYATNNEGNSASDDFNITVSNPGVASDLLIVKTPSVFYSDANRTVQYIITLANETSSAIDAQIEDVLRVYHYSTATGTTGSEVTGKDLNITIVDDGVFMCNLASSSASSFSCAGTVPRRTGNGGVPGLVRIIYTITTPDDPAPALLLNTVGIEDSSTEANASVIVGVTPGGVVITPPPEHADVIDTDMWTSIDNYNAGISKVIKTKISAKPFVQMSAIHLDGNELASVYTPNDTGLSYLIIPYLSNDMCSEQETLYDSDTGKAAVFNITNGNTIDTKNITIPAHARKNARISVSFLDLDQLYIDSGVRCAYTSSAVGNLAGLGQCVNSANNYYDAFGLTAYERCQTRNGRPCEPTNHGESNPSDPTYNPLYDNELGCLMCTLNAFPDCSSDNFAIRPNKLDVNSSHVDMPNLLRSAQDYNTTISAYNYGSTTNTPEYNVMDANSTYVITTTKYMKNNDINSSMAGIATFSNNGFNMLDGLSVKSGVSGHEVAGLTFDDVGKINISIQDQNWSAVDINNAVDTTPHDCSANGAYVCGDKNVTFIPEHFTFSNPGLGITNNNGNPGTFTYIANEVGQMAGRIYTTMKAENKLNAPTLNFSAFPMWENNVTVVPVVTKSTYLYPDANETNITNLAIGFGMGVKTIAYDETNTSQYLRFNFRRDINLPQNSFDVNGTDLNISMTSHYVDPDNAAKSADINGSRLGSVLPGDGGSKFVYGRVIPRDIRVFGANISFTANAWYEDYNTSTIGSTGLPVSRNDGAWFTNTLHSDASDGDSNVTVVITGTNPINATAANGIETYSFGNSYGLGGYKAHILTAPWLWYGLNASPYANPVTGNSEAACLTHPCFNINVVPAVGATGSAKSTNTDTKASKKSEGTGTWKSTKDYAPAIR